jgi:hypothetical protein
MITLKDYKDWLKGYEAVVKECEVQFEQANIVMPMIKNKIKELEELEKVEVQEVKDGK